MPSYKRTILITGSTDGIGREAAMELCKNPESRIIIHGRSQERCAQALQYIKEHGKVKAENVDWVTGDFSDLKTVVAMADDLKTRFPQFNVVVCNAGVLSPQRKTTADKLELTFQVNHLAHFLLINCILDLLKSNQPSRVAVVSSLSHDWCKELNWADLQAARPGAYEKYEQYSASKLANHLFGFGLARRLANSGVCVNVLEPGVIQTKLLAAGGFSGASVSEGAVPLIYLAQNPAAEGVSGKYFNSRAAIIAPASQSLDESAQDKLWDLSIQLCKDANVWPH